MCATLLARAASAPAVALLGPRQSGKTTLAQQAFANWPYVSLERPDERERARVDPLGFLARFPDRVILDEVQRCPGLLSYLQVLMDEAPRPGRFILTGSQNFLLMQNVSQTLAGRVAILQLLPLSITELFEREPLSPLSLDTNPVRGIVAPPKSLWETLWAGLYPRIHDLQLDPTAWLADYQRTYVERDVRDVLRVMDVDAFHRFVRLTAARTGQELNLAELASDAGVTQPTASHWISALRTGFILTVLPAHHANFRKRLRKRPKLHFFDTGLVCYLLGISSPAVLENHPLRGAIFESYVVSELTKAFWNQGLDAPLYHWRDASGHEVDIVIDFGTRLVPVEVKSAITLASDAVDSLRWWVALKGNTNKDAAIVYGGSEGAALHGVNVVPWFFTDPKPSASGGEYGQEHAPRAPLRGTSVR